MKEAIITILGIVLVLIIGAGVYFAFFNGANDMGEDAVSQQGKLQQMTSDSETVGGNMVKYYAEQADDVTTPAMVSEAFDGDTASVESELNNHEFEELHIGVRIQESGGKTIITDINEIQSQVNDSGVYNVKKYFDSNGELYVVVFDQTDLSS